MVLTLVLAESAIELVPKEIHGHPTVRASAERKNKPASELILDQNYHHAAILKLPKKGMGRGRPDIAHVSSLMALGSPLNMEHKLKCYIHTQDNSIIKINPETRLPRSTERFVSLLEQLFKESRVPKTGTPLLELKQMELSKLLGHVKPDRVVALTTQGTNESLPYITSQLSTFSRPLVLVGGFQEGHFSRSTLQLAHEKYRIDSRRLEAATVVARLMYDFETAIGLERFQT